MQLYKYLPLPSDRMGVMWALASVKDACIIEYGPAGTTHYGIEGFMKLNAEMRARIFTTHMDESDLVMGDSKRLEDTILEADAVYNPPVIFVLASSLSSIIGTDIDSICENLQPNVKAKLIGFTGGGFRGDYTLGIREVMTAIAKHIVKPCVEKRPNTYNILGCNIDSYNYLSDLVEVQDMMKQCFGMELNTVFTANTSVEELERASMAQFNLVLRSEALESARIMKESFDIDFYSGCPYGLSGTMEWIKGIEKTFSLKANPAYIGKQMEKTRKLMIRLRHSILMSKKYKTILSGNYDFVMDIFPFLTQELSLKIEKVFVNHPLKGSDYREMPEALKDRTLFHCDEEKKQDLLQEIKPEVLLGDGILLEMGQQAPVKLQVSNPNLHQIHIYEYTPFMGFKGATYFIELLMNQITMNQSKL